MTTRKAFIIGKPSTRRLDDGRWEATLPAMGLRALGSTKQEAKSAMRGVLFANVNSWSEEEKVAWRDSLPQAYFDEQCRLVDERGTMIGPDLHAAVEE